MELKPVKSSNIDAIGYEEASETLFVRFKGGGTYKYTLVPRKTFDALEKAGSKGAFFNQVIKDRFKAIRI
jgi:hypothetical protein